MIFGKVIQETNNFYQNRLSFIEDIMKNILFFFGHILYFRSTP